jgi:glyoxylase-like metal-dependent hydrolase (beta-lactamase superfamily II)
MNPITIPLSMTKVYLMPCRGGYLQIDTGYPHDYPKYRRRLERAGVKLSDVRYLFLTHHHDDHAGFLNDITRDADLVIIAHETAKDLLLTGKNDKSRGGGYVNRPIKIVADIKMRLDPRWTLTFPPFALRQQDILLSGDDNVWLRQIGIDGDILYTPGHCIDHLTLLLKSGEVFCGDAAASFPLWLGTRYCTVFMTDMDEGYRSWQKILDAGGQVIYPAHGRRFAADQLRRHMGRITTAQLVRFF